MQRPNRSVAGARRVAAGLCLLGPMLVAGGCARDGRVPEPPPAPSDLPEAATLPPSQGFSARSYRAVFEAVTNSLEDLGFAIDRSDYRYGVITTDRRAVPSFVEVWRPDGTTVERAVVGTLNQQQRWVRVALERIDETDDGGDALPGYRLRVEAFIEQAQKPLQYLNGSTSSRVFARLDALGRRRTDRGEAAKFDRVIQRDPAFEAGVLDRVDRRLARESQG